LKAEHKIDFGHALILVLLMQHKNQFKKLMQIKEQGGFTFKNNALQNVHSWGEGINYTL
jgi:hypothetical protein